MTAFSVPLRNALPAVAAALALALLARYGAIEAKSVTAACLADAKPAWCAWRVIMVQVLRSPALGMLAVGAAIVAHMPIPGRWPGPTAWAALAMATGLAGLILYTPVLGAIGLVFGLVRLVRGYPLPVKPTAVKTG